jgi:trehalose-6-phosphate synthase
MNDEIEVDIENKKREIQLILLYDFINLNNIRFTSPYFQTLTGQQISEVITISVDTNEFNKIIKEHSPNNIRKKFLRKQAEKELLIISRDESGDLYGTVNFKNDHISISYTNPERQKKIVSDNISKKVSLTKELISKS